MKNIEKDLLSLVKAGEVEQVYDPLRNEYKYRLTERGRRKEECINQTQQTEYY